MPYSLEWHTPKRILYQRFYGLLTLEEIRALSDETFACIQQGENPTHMILDMRA